MKIKQLTNVHVGQEVPGSFAQDLTPERKDAIIKKESYWRREIRNMSADEMERRQQDLGFRQVLAVLDELAESRQRQE